MILKRRIFLRSKSVLLGVTKTMDSGTRRAEV
jgi:hypothetical protein